MSATHRPQSDVGGAAAKPPGAAPRAARWTALAAALCAGALTGALALGLWSQHWRRRELGRSPWDPRGPGETYAGSASCRECHARFYELWSPSRHGKAMQPVTPALVQEALTPPAEPLTVGASRFSVDLAACQVVEEGPGGRTVHPMVHALGGKNVFFFLTPGERGRLQVLPLAYDVRRREWFDTTGSMVRHFPDQPDAALHWQDPLLTFNTACYNCHVSQLESDYDALSDAYHTTWREPGINCEACHGPNQGHIRACRAAPEGTVPTDLRTIRWGSFSAAQANDACSPCHAKMRPLAPVFMPGDRFFDHYDLVCLEDRDFHPDGRDLGENYTLTGWLMNPCAQSGALDCTHCHTSSGRFRQKDDPNSSCLPCHARRVRTIRSHSRHPQTAKAPTCVSCHLPMTEFSRMLRSDHSFRPPCPEAGERFGSPVACLLCHQEQSTTWAAKTVRAWHPQSRWQERILREGALVDAARRGRWEQLPGMLDHLLSDAADPVVSTSLIRLLGRCPRPEKWPAIRRAMGHASPLVRGAAAEALGDDLGQPESLALLIEALSDDLRLVRVRAAAALAPLPRDRIDSARLPAFNRAEDELLASFAAQPDAWSSHYNHGNYRSSRGEAEAALQAYDRAIALRADVVMPYVNAAVTASQLGRLQQSVSYLGKAHRLAPEDGAVNLNLGLALAESGDLATAEKHLRLALKNAEARAQSAFNLAVLVAPRDPQEAVRLCRTAVQDAPENPRYVHTLAYYLAGVGEHSEAIALLEALVSRQRDNADAWVLLARCCLDAGRADEAARHYRAMRDNQALPEDVRRLADRTLQAMEQRGRAAPPP